METATLLFIDIGWADIVDILLVAYLLYAIYKLVKGSVAMNILAGLLLLYFMWKIVDLAHMRMLSEILNQFISVGVLALIIVFQPEIRKFLIILGQQASTGIRKNSKTGFLKKLLGDNTTEIDIDEIVEACKNMAAEKTGAIIVLTRSNQLEEEINSGQEIEGIISAPLIESIFYKNNPLHDGALIITNNRIKAARCVLPITERTSFPADYGLRHRAGAGVTEQTDAFVIIVSEQTGKIAIASDGEVRFNLSVIELKRTLLTEFTQRKKDS